MHACMHVFWKERSLMHTGGYVNVCSPTYRIEIIHACACML